MNKAQKSKLILEADLQTKEINKLKIWLKNSITVSTIGFVIALFGMQKSNWWFVIGSIATVLSVIVAIIINMGIKNGKLNVEKILRLIDIN